MVLEAASTAISIVCRRPYPLAGLDMRHGGSNFLHNACHLTPSDPWELWETEVVVDGFVIDLIESHGACPDFHFVLRKVGGCCEVGL